ncbi:Ig-like domain-containing protein [Robertkochia sediminum]|uniref:Ig-like domain-containing protein n=1 Tax=Robertkochia sediminum TaxID=2785326 RepID=UPI00193320DA|nr:Ig-like domain-containing protein [Robertkochia sediminum]MBL7471416.1 Ig-like domain-containing protein [Robertkochia sediminum]
MNDLFKRLMPLCLVLLTLVGCSSGSEETDAPALSVFGVTVSGMNGRSNPEGVALNTTISINFSSALKRSAFESALSITDPNGAVPFEVSYSNAAATANITLNDLAPMAEHQFELRTGSLGEKGERLQEALTFRFTTVADNSFSACTSGTAACLRSFSIDANGTGHGFQFYSNYDVTGDPEQVWAGIKNLIVVVHGQNRDADNYFRIMNQTITGTALEGKTLVIAPYFKDDAAAGGDELFWGSSWRFGANASNAGTSVSSFAVIDALINEFTGDTRFPDMANVMVTGHSSGASFTHYYALSSEVAAQHPGLNFGYSVLNSQYFFYPTGQRFDESNGSWSTPANCGGYTSWPYGYDYAPAYLDGVEKNEVVQRLSAVNMTLFHGENDTSTTGTLNTDDCAAVLLGSNRLERGKNYNNYLNTYFSGNHTELITVPNAAHDAGAMYGSSAFISYLEGVISN